MKCLVLAAGYATRLYPLTKDFPKPLLQVQGKTILDWLVQDLAASGLVEEYVVISNHRFADHFRAWAAGTGLPVTVLDDGTTCNENRLGAVRDVLFAIDQLGLDDELLVIAGDNVLDFSLNRFVAYAKRKGATCVMRYHEADPRRLRKSGVLEVNGEDLVLSMEEKPENPRSCWCCPPFYYYAREDAALVRQAIADGCGVDAPGSFIAWLSSRKPVYAMAMPGRRYDIGDLESYEAVSQHYRGILPEDEPEKGTK